MDKLTDVVEAKITRDPDTDEFVVKAYTPMGRRPEADYFTDDRDDAESTRWAMTGYLYEVRGDWPEGYGMHLIRVRVGDRLRDNARREESTVTKIDKVAVYFAAGGRFEHEWLRARLCPSIEFPNGEIEKVVS